MTGLLNLILFQVKNIKIDTQYSSLRSKDICIGIEHTYQAWPPGRRRERVLVAAAARSSRPCGSLQTLAILGRPAAQACALKQNADRISFQYFHQEIKMHSSKLLFRHIFRWFANLRTLATILTWFCTLHQYHDNDEHYVNQDATCYRQFTLCIILSSINWDKK